MTLIMNLFQLFKASLHSPKKIAAFRLIPIGKVMQYIFIFIFLLTIISFVQFINGISVQQSSMEGLLEYFEDIQWLLYPFAFVFLFVLNTLFSFIRISIFAYIGTFILYTNEAKRRLPTLMENCPIRKYYIYDPFFSSCYFTIGKWLYSNHNLCNYIRIFSVSM